MKTTYVTAMERGVFPHEGGYSNHPSDPGGPTNWGITIADARMYWKHDATAADVKSMPKTVAEDIYRKHYAAALRYDDLPTGVDYAVLDYGINSGISRAGKVLRRVCGETDSDWHVTDAVMAAVAKRKSVDLINAICDERLAFLKRLKTWPVFGPGWERRVREVRAMALDFAKAAAQLTVVVSNAPAQGKGAVAAPPAPVKDIVAKGSVPAIAAGGGAHWYANSALITGVVIVGAIVIVIVAAYAIHRNHQANQDAATPGLVPVPLAA